MLLRPMRETEIVPLLPMPVTGGTMIWLEATVGLPPPGAITMLLVFVKTNGPARPPTPRDWTITVTAWVTERLAAVSFKTKSRTFVLATGKALGTTPKARELVLACDRLGNTPFVLVNTVVPIWTLLKPGLKTDRANAPRPLPS